MVFNRVVDEVIRGEAEASLGDWLRFRQHLALSATVDSVAIHH